MKDGYSYTRLSNGMAHPDGETLAFRIERADGAFLDISCSRSDIAEIIRDLIRFAATDEEQAAGGAPLRNLLSAGPALGLVLSQSNDPDRSLLIVRTPGIDVSFEIQNSELPRLGDDFALAAKTMAAPTMRKN
jgi:hypothetical protein